MPGIMAVVLSLLASPLYAEQQLTFKKELIANVHWLPYGLLLIALLAVLLILAKKSSHTTQTKNQCKIIEKVQVHHKTTIYVLDYLGQRFLLADNQNALSIQALQEISPVHEK